MSVKAPIKPILEHYGASFVPESDRWRPMRCPFHTDGTASASVNTEEGVYKCHACDIGGDGIAVVRWREALEFTEAVSFIEGLGLTVEGYKQKPAASAKRHFQPEPGQTDLFSTRRRRPRL